MILDAANICNDVNILNILSIVRTIVKIITIAIPIVLILFIILDVIKTISSTDVDNKKMTKSIGRRIIAAVIVFLLPYIVDFVMENMPFNSYYLDCYNKATSESILEISISNYNTSRIACEQANEVYNKCNEMCSHAYQDAYSKCEQANQDAKLITDKDTREQAKAAISAELNKLKSIRNGKK